MEILNNIWMVLSSPNEFYKKLLVAPLGFIEAYIAMSLFLSMLNISSTKKDKLKYVILFPIVSNIINICIPAPFNVFINYLSGFIFIIAIFRLKPFKALIAVVSPIATFAVVSIFVSNLYITFLNISAEQLASVPIYNFGYLLFLYIFTLVILYILRLKNFKITILENIDIKNKSIILTNLIFGILNIIVQACIIFYYIDTLPILITSLSCISLLVYFGISLYSLSKAMKLTLTRKKLESAEEYNKTLHILHDSVRGFKHDFDNIVTTIGGYIRTNDMEGLKSYYIQLEDDCQRVNNLYLLNPEIINNPRNL